MTNLTIKADELEAMYEEILTILGAFTIDVDIEKKEVIIILRRAFQEFQKETSIWQLQNQFGNVYGLPAGQAMSNQLAVFNMNLVTQITDWFSAMARVGGKIPWHKDYIILEPGRQIYDLSKESSKPYIPGTRKIHKVMWQSTPELLSGGKFRGGMDTLNGDDILNSSFWNFGNTGLNYGSNPLMYLGQAFDTMLMLQSTEIRKKLLFSEFFYNLSGDMLEVFPMPGGQGLNIGLDTKVFYYYFDEKELLAGGKIEENPSNTTEYTDSNGNLFKKLQVIGTQDGLNKVFTVIPAPIEGTEMVILNGQVVTRGQDYSINGSTITFTDLAIPILANTVLSVHAEYPIDVSTETSDTLSASNQVLLANPLQFQLNTIPWDMLSPWAKTWIWEWTLARCKYIQGSKWRKIKKTFDSSDNGYEIEFDYQSLLTEAADEMRQLREDLRTDLKELNLLKLMQDKKEIVDSARSANRGPRLPFIG